MPPAGPVRVYKPTGVRIGLTVVFSALFGGLGIGLIADYRDTGWSGLVAGPLVIMLSVVMAATLLTSSVTIHEQGIVVRQYFGREFIPWQAVKAINAGELIRDPAMTVPERGSRPVVSVWLDTGVKYMEEWRRLDATGGSYARTRQIADEMEDFRRRDQAARAAAADDVIPSAMPPPVTPAPPDPDDSNPPPFGKALW